ncbi:MAG: tetratricopeptide repeat-containing protein [Erythrobacter sp.]
MSPSIDQQRSHILRLARAGNPVRAWALFGEQKLDIVRDDPKVLTLEGRLQKDLAERAQNGERKRLYHAASESYLAAFALTADSYPLINAATLAFLSGDGAAATQRAQQTLEMIERDPEEGETPYWRQATRAEALLLLGQSDAAQAALQDGIEALPLAWEDHAATLGQFERIVAAQSGDPQWLDAFRPACSVHFSGLMELDPNDPQLQRDIAKLVAELRPGFAFGALAAGADIMLAEALVESGAQLHLVLPFDAAHFRQVSVAPFGGDWEERFDALMARAETVEEWGGQGNGDAAIHPASITAANCAAMGLCLRQAETLRSKAAAITVSAPGEAERAHIRDWQRTGRSVHTIKTKRVDTAQTDIARTSSGQILAKPNLVGAASDPTALISFSQLDSVELSQIAQKFDLLRSQGKGKRYLHGSIRSAVPAILDLARSGTNRGVKSGTKSEATAGASFHVTSNQDDVASEVSEDLTSRMATAASAGEVFADRNSALIAKALAPSLRIEEIGEMGSLYGPISLWSLRQ